MDSYTLSRNYWDWAFENPDLVNPTSGALYFFAIEHCNRLGWKEKFGLPTEMAMSAIGVKNYRTYYKAFEFLIEHGFIKVVTRSKNQYSANVIALVENTKAHTKAYTKATLQHLQKQSLSIVDINKPNNLIPDNHINDRKIIFENEVLSFLDYKQFHEEFIRYWTEPNQKKTKMRFELEKTWHTLGRLATWKSRSNTKPKSPITNQLSEKEGYENQSF